MCGIVGMSFREGSENWRKNDLTKIKECFTKMLKQARARGSAATGVVLISRGERNKASVFRAPLTAQDFVETEEYKKLMDRLDEKAVSIIGHTRAVTFGDAANNLNNHPHIAGSIIGVHNGSIRNDRQLWTKYSGHMKPKGSCDSEVIFALINQKTRQHSNDMGRAVTEAVEELRGWLAVAFVDVSDPGKVYLFRDSMSPLEIAWSNYGEVALFASEFDYIKESFEESQMQGKLSRYQLDPYVLATLDSTVRGRSTEILVHYKKVRKPLTPTDKLSNRDQRIYDVTQGRRRTL